LEAEERPRAGGAAEGVAKLTSVDGQRHRVHAVAVQHCGDPALGQETPAGGTAGGAAGFGQEGDFCHWGTCSYEWICDRVGRLDLRPGEFTASLEGCCPGWVLSSYAPNQL